MTNVKRKSKSLVFGGKMKKKIKVLIALYGALGLKGSVKLNKNASIRGIKLIGEDDFFKFTNWNTKGRATCPYNWIIDLDYEYNANNSSPPYPQQIFIENQHIDYALGLYFQNSVGLAAIIVNPQAPKNYIVSDKIGGSLSVNVFDKNISFEEFWKKYIPAYNKKPAVYEYFSRALEYPNNIKSILFCSSLESLFVPEDEKNKKRDFVLQGLTILGFDKTEQAYISELFTFRNAYIHANKKKQFELNLGSKFLSPWWEKCEKIMRKILFRHIELSW